MEYEIFISYQTESLWFVEQFCDLLQHCGIRCWYAPRNVISNHAREIPEAIKHCKIFLLIVDDNVATNPREDILNEVYIACNLFKKGMLDMITINITEKEYESAELLYHIGRLQKKFFVDNMLPDGAKKILPELLAKLGRSELDIHLTAFGASHYKNNYFEISDEQERKRLNIQQRIVKKFDDDIYEKILHEKSMLSVLDIGCNEGHLIMDRFAGRREVSTIVGVDINKDAITRATELYGSDNIYFYALDCEDANFCCDLIDLLDSKGIEKFDIIHISMLLLHIETPQNVLKRIKQLLKPNGTILIRDIDDQLTFVRPDPIGAFRRMIKICENERLSGYRHNGTEIFSMLIEAGYKNVKLEKKGLDTSFMTAEEKEALFHTYFSFIYDDCKKLYQREPKHSQYKTDYMWLNANFDKTKAFYDKPSTLCCLGFMTYTANK